MKIIIIGAGFCGTTLATELAKAGDDHLQVNLLGAAESFGRGVAFGESRPEHLLNVRADRMGAAADDAGEFADWMQLDASARSAFLPRRAYGDYLLARLERALATTHAQVNRIGAKAIGVSRQGDGFRVQLDDGCELDGDVVVLALGTLPPRPLPGISDELARHRAYMGWPWQRPGIEAIDADARLLIVGTGLTMADVVTTLKAQGHRGPIQALSRHGLLPSVHPQQPHAHPPLPAAMQEALPSANVRTLLRALRTSVRAGTEATGVIDALRPHLQDLWQALPLAQQARFLRHLRAYWDVTRHRLAPEVATQLDALQASGQLQIHAGRLLEAGLRSDEVEVRWRARASTQIRSSRHDLLIRATGFDTDVQASSQPLLQQLREANLISADPLRLGLRSNAQLEMLDGDSAAVRGLYCLGPLLRPQWWEITAVPELRVVTSALAQRLLQQAARH